MFTILTSYNDGTFATEKVETLKAAKAIAIEESKWESTLWSHVSTGLATIYRVTGEFV